MASGGERGGWGKGEIGVKIQGAQIKSRAVDIGKAVPAVCRYGAERGDGIFPNIGAAAGRIVLIAGRIPRVVIAAYPAALGNQRRVNAQIIVAVEAH